MSLQSNPFVGVWVFFYDTLFNFNVRHATYLQRNPCELLGHPWPYVHVFLIRKGGVTKHLQEVVRVDLFAAYRL